MAYPPSALKPKPEKGKKRKEKSPANSFFKAVYRAFR
jgi:hypothetical protein